MHRVSFFTPVCWALLASACASVPPAPLPPPPRPATVEADPSSTARLALPPPQATFSDDDWGTFVDEAKIEALLQRVSVEHQPETIVFDHITVVSMAHPGAEKDRRVVVEGGTIRAVGPAPTTPAPPNARVVDGHGRWLLPGLVDTHVRTLASSSSYLLDLANGVTSVREMDGFPWLLAMRAAVSSGRLLAPNLYVASHILSGVPMDWHATEVQTPEQARAAVNRQANLGYEAIVVHERMLPAPFDAICGEAHKRGLDVVGIVPQQVGVAHAIACPMRTLEHFTGYALDDGRTLSSAQDYARATRGVDVWNTPTLSSWSETARGDEARRLLRYVPARQRAQWTKLADEKPDASRESKRALEEKLFRDLAGLHARLLAGTDSGDANPYEVRGFALHEELAEMQRLGMSPYEALRTATAEPALAMRKEGTVGTITPGQRADLLLLSADPLATVTNTEWEHIEGTLVRGTWLTHAEMADLLDQVAEIYGGPVGRSLSRDEVEAAVRTFEELRADDWPLRSHLLRALRPKVTDIGLPVYPAMFRGIDDAPPPGPCATLPSEECGRWEAPPPARWHDAIFGYQSGLIREKVRELGSAAVPFAVYLNAMHNRVHPWFADRYLVALDKRPKGDQLSNDQLSVSLEIALAIDGHIARIGVVRSSGIAEFDAAALESFARAAPFGPVPPAITSADGNVWMRWDMRRDEVFACSTMNARPYLVGP